jgi:hypothetical protein
MCVFLVVGVSVAALSGWFVSKVSPARWLSLTRLLCTCGGVPYRPLWLCPVPAKKYHPDLAADQVGARARAP